MLSVVNDDKTVHDENHHRDSVVQDRVIATSAINDATHIAENHVSNAAAAAAAEDATVHKYNEESIRHRERVTHPRHRDSSVRSHFVQQDEISSVQQPNSNEAHVEQSETKSNRPETDNHSDEEKKANMVKSNNKDDETITSLLKSHQKAMAQMQSTLTAKEDTIKHLTTELETTREMLRAQSTVSKQKYNTSQDGPQLQGYNQLRISILLSVSQ